MTEAEQRKRTAKIQEIRNAALDYLDGNSSDFRVHAYVKKLEAFRSRPATGEWLEAVVLVQITKRIKPTRTLGMMNHLSKLRTRQGNQQAFTEFSNMVNAYLSPFRVTAHGYKEDYFSDANNDIALDSIGDLVQRFRAIGYEVILNSGTLLGVVRDGRLIEHDDDVDLAVLLRSKNRTDAAREWVALLSELERLNLLGDTDSGQNEIYKLRRIGEFEVDLFPCWIEDEKVYIYPHTHGEIGVSSLVPTQACSTTGHPIPADPRSFLTQNYGANWSTPDPYFIFPWRKQKRLFQKFIDDVQSFVDEENALENAQSTND
ncbi:hypothetical protein ACFE33_01960 [Falsihalocynthiibacter sp. SS001]|uniref:hypothetical protein n=1 Tax=Falsihalocynthiibacter sp. SS001 TaxID=3349698 RepID=UPI0036D3B95E